MSSEMDSERPLSGHAFQLPVVYALSLQASRGVSKTSFNAFGSVLIIMIAATGSPIIRGFSSAVNSFITPFFFRRSILYPNCVLVVSCFSGNLGCRGPSFILKYSEQFLVQFIQNQWRLVLESSNSWSFFRPDKYAADSTIFHKCLCQLVIPREEDVGPSSIRDIASFEISW